MSQESAIDSVSPTDDMDETADGKKLDAIGGRGAGESDSEMEDVEDKATHSSDPSYAKKLDKTKVTGKVIRAICIMNQNIPNTAEAESVQIILPQKQLKRNSDIYITMVSSTHAVCA